MRRPDAPRPDAKASPADRALSESIPYASLFPHVKSPTHSLLRMGRNLLSAVPPIFPIRHGRDSSTRLTHAYGQSYRPRAIAAGLTPAAPVGNSCGHLNAGKLTADGSPSLCGNDALLCTLIAFLSVTVPIVEASLQNVKTLFHPFVPLRPRDAAASSIPGGRCAGITKTAIHPQWPLFWQ